MTTPTPEAIEAAARALFEETQELDQDNSWDDPLPDEWRESWRNAAREAIAAAAPFIAAQAKAEALREAADACAPDYETTDTRSVAKWLRARAATIEGKSE